MHDTDRETSPPMGLLVLVDESETILEQSFEADDAAWLARELSRWAKELLDMSAAREAGMPLFGPNPNPGANDAQRAVGPLRAQIVIPDESGNHVEWRFETSSENVAQLADWLVEVGKWQRRPSAERETPQGLVGPDSEPNPKSSLTPARRGSAGERSSRSYELVRRQEPGWAGGSESRARGRSAEPEL